MSLLTDIPENNAIPSNTETASSTGAPEEPGNGVFTPTWYWDENVPGTGNRPDYLPEKYKSVADMAKAQRELERKLGSAPEKYDFSKGLSWMEPDYPAFQELADYAKSKHVPQDVMDKMLESVSYYFDEFKFDQNAEREKLGPKAVERLTLLNNWAKANLSENAFNVLTASMRSADQVEALEELRIKMIGSNTMIPGGNAGNTAPGYTIEEYRSELQSNYEKYKTDPAFRKTMERKLQSIKG